MASELSRFSRPGPSYTNVPSGVANRQLRLFPTRSPHISVWLLSAPQRRQTGRSKKWKQIEIQHPWSPLTTYKSETMQLAAIHATGIAMLPGWRGLEEGEIYAVMPSAPFFQRKRSFLWMKLSAHSQVDGNNRKVDPSISHLLKPPHNTLLICLPADSRFQTYSISCWLIP